MKKSATLLLLAIVLLAGCQAAPEAAATPTPTQFRPSASPAPKALPSPSATRQPSLKEREWNPRPVLLRLDLIRKDEGILNPPAPPQFILYADGGAFITRPAVAGYPHGDQQLLFKKMERAEICRILNALDLFGFLDYDPAAYSFEGEPGGLYDAYFEVNAWKSRRGTYPDLPLFVFNELTGRNQDAARQVPPALRAAYALTADYPADGFEPYQPEQMGVWIRPLNAADFPNQQWETWDFPALTLSYLYSKIETGGAAAGFAILRKQGAANLYEYLKESFSIKYYVETNRLGEKSYYAAYARPLAPYEIPGKFETEAPAPNFKLECLPSDGAAEIPRPHLIYALPIP